MMPVEVRFSPYSCEDRETPVSVHSAEIRGWGGRGVDGDGHLTY
jgi:hypothetical protein